MCGLAGRLPWLLWAPAALLALACDSSGQGPGSGTGGGSATGGSGGAGGQGDEDTALLDCSKGDFYNSYVVAYANPAHFSVNSETGAQDQHTAMVSLAYWSARRTLYMTTGSADHRHEIPFPDALLEELRQNRPVVATTTPPLNAATGHTHTVMFRSCGVPSN